MLLDTKLRRVGIYDEELPFINSHNSLITLCYISTTTMTMANKLGRVVLYNDEPNSIKW